MADQTPMKFVIDMPNVGVLHLTTSCPIEAMDTLKHLNKSLTTPGVLYEEETVRSRVLCAFDENHFRTPRAA